MSLDFTNAETEVVSRSRVRKLTAAWSAKRGPALLDALRKRRPSLKSSTALAVSADKPRPRWREQFKLLFTRSWRQITRSRGANIARAMSNVFSAVVFGVLFFQMGNGQTSVQVPDTT